MGRLCLSHPGCQTLQNEGCGKCNFGDRKGTTKKLRDKDLAERSGALSGAICLKTLVLQANVTPSNCSENYLVLFVRFFGFVSPFWLLNVGRCRKLVHRISVDP